MAGVVAKCTKEKCSAVDEVQLMKNAVVARAVVRDVGRVVSGTDVKCCVSLPLQHCNKVF